MSYSLTIGRFLRVSGLSLLVPLLGATSSGRQYYGRVTQVLAGDQLEVTRQGRREHVRVYGIECLSGHWGEAARQFTRQMAGSRGVHLHIRDHDGHGSSISEVHFIGGRSLGEELVRNGLARWSREAAPHDKRLALLESEARLARKGLWADSSRRRAVRRAGYPQQATPAWRRTNLARRTTPQ